MRFRATIEQHGVTATGFEVPGEVIDALASGRRPPVVVTIGRHSYRSTAAVRGGRFLVPLSAQNRAAAGVVAGEEVEVGIEADAAPREVEVPDDLAQALAGDEAAGRTFGSLPYTHRKEWVRWIEEAKKPETRSRRLAETVSALREGRRGR